MKSSVLIGQIVNIHGINGELKVYPYTDDIDNLCNLKEVYLDESLRTNFKVKSARVHKNMLLLTLNEIKDANEALKYKEKNVYIDKATLPELDDDEYYIEDLIGMEVYDEKDNLIGNIEYVFNTGANDVYEIKTLDDKKIYLPAIHDVIKKVDIKAKKMYVEIMEGLI